MPIDPTAGTNLGTLEGVVGRLADVERRLSGGAASTGSGGVMNPGAITGDQISDGSIQTGHIVAGTIVAGHIEAGAITADAIAAGSINAGHIQADAINATHIQADAIETDHIQADAIVAGHIASGTIVSDHIATGTIVAADIAATTITGGNIAAGTITSTNIASATITGSLIAAGTITGTNLVAGTITATEIGVSSLSAISANLGTMTAGSITGATLQTASSGARVIMDSTGIRGKNGAGTDVFFFDTATGTLTLTGTVSSSSVVPAATITGTFPASAIPPIGGGNWLLNSSATNSTTGYGAVAGVLAASATQAKFGAVSFRITATGANSYLESDSFGGGVNKAQGLPGEKWTSSAWVYVPSARTVHMYTRAIDSGGVYVNQASTSHAVPANTWTRVSNTYTLPASTVYVGVAVLSQESVNTEVWYIDGVQLEQGEVATGYAPRADEILPNTIDGGTHIVAASITGTQIAAATISGTHIIANTIEAGNIAAGTITSVELAAGSVTSDVIAAGAVTAETLAAEIILAGTIRTATTGRRVELDADGVRLIAASEATLVDLPTDSSKAASFTGEISAASLTVLDNLTVRGTNNVLDVGAQLSVSGQQSPPSTALTAEFDNELLVYSVYDPGGGLSVPAWNQNKGIFYDSAGYNPGGGTQATVLIGYILSTGSAHYVAVTECKATDGTLLRAAVVYLGGGSNQQFCQGVVRKGSTIYLAAGSNIPGGGGSIAVYRLRQSDLVQRGTTGIIANADSPMLQTHKCAFGYDGTYLCLLTTQASTANTGLRVRRYSDNDTLDNGSWSFVDNKDLTGLNIFEGRLVASAPYAPSLLSVCYVSGKWWCAHAHGGIRGANSFDGTTLALDTETGFTSLGQVTHDGTQFRSAVIDGAWRLGQKHTNWTWTTSNTYIVWSFTYYTTTGPAETTASPSQTALNVRPLTVADPGGSGGGVADSASRAHRRARVKLTVPTLPGTVPKFRVYMAHNTATTIASSSLKLQAATTYVSDDDSYPVYQTDENASGAAPPASNTWPGGTPAKLKSSIAVSGGGWELSGTGNKGIVPTGGLMPFGGSSAPIGWVLCDGTSYLRTGDYADLFAVIGTTYGAADGTHFNVPDLRGRVAVGLGTHADVNALGDSDGEATVANRRPKHVHTMSSKGENPGSGSVTTPNTNTTDAAGPHWLTLNYIIKL
jgi:microcystin-dependent protein